ncbi:MAG: hypothetical protein PVI92_10010 [Chromatiales bacterium]|jgi:hypothetical protein
MDRRWRLNLTLLAAAGLLGLLIWRAQPPRLPPLTPLDPAHIEQIEISDLSGRHILLKKVAGIWRSGTAAADQRRIAQLLGICTTPSLERFPAAADLTPFNLAPAPIRLRLDSLTLDFGTTDPLNGWRYVHMDKQVHLIADGFYHHLTAPPEAWLESH